MIAGVEHDRQVSHDYALLRSVGMQAARDGIRWHLIDRGGHYDFSSFTPMLKAALEHGIQIIWDVCHYGWPDDVNLLSPAFVDRFARFAAACARVVRDHSDEVPFYAPMNEMNFLVWGIGSGMVYPYTRGRDNEIKEQLIRASIAGSEAIWSVDPRARMVYPEPVIHVLPPRNRPDLAQQAASYRASQFEAWDALAGRSHPQLGGHPKYLDILGANFYHSNEWEIEGSGRLRWEDEPRDDRWLPFHKILIEVWQRYHRPLFVAETSHFGVGRARWIREIANEVYKARLEQAPVEGICLYPILDRYDWSDDKHWHNSGLWDFVTDEKGRLERVLNPEYAAELRNSQQLLAKIACV